MGNARPENSSREPLLLNYAPVVMALSADHSVVFDPRLSSCLKTYYQLVKQRYDLKPAHILVWAFLSKGIAQDRVSKEFPECTRKEIRSAVSTLINKIGADNAFHAGYIGGKEDVELLEPFAREEVCKKYGIDF